MINSCDSVKTIIPFYNNLLLNYLTLPDVIYILTFNRICILHEKHLLIYRAFAEMLQYGNMIPYI